MDQDLFAEFERDLAGCTARLEGRADELTAIIQDLNGLRARLVDAIRDEDISPQQLDRLWGLFKSTDPQMRRLSRLIGEVAFES